MTYFNGILLGLVLTVLVIKKECRSRKSAALWTNIYKQKIRKGAGEYFRLDQLYCGRIISDNP